ncbi:uncharacterized protein PHALS_15378 [Plasmopara halstedii]|uniref:Uncharacterized protein n=1 Tax=Plasmopara halstedii TaxID=4781 RepID=A0A0P1A4K3_PLAHL|nr:uncharacterized protein PHALS_15378 [Plasmopara halstedii]CEG35428.1 hypothetical protein PHALS_15378 [Plasmopara halstedii]|eukprot:XP_024571797.1 hypothetical protein PHALS_15378 [Plasmopara halstedii]
MRERRHVNGTSNTNRRTNTVECHISSSYKSGQIGSALTPGYKRIVPRLVDTNANIRFKKSEQDELATTLLKSQIAFLTIDINESAVFRYNFIASSVHYIESNVQFVTLMLYLKERTRCKQKIYKVKCFNK